MPGENVVPERLKNQGHFQAMVVCWILGLGSLLAWNSVFNVGDYYTILFKKYHPTRSLTIVHQPFALITMVILIYKEAKVNTRLRNLYGYGIYTATILSLLLLDIGSSGKGGMGPFIALCFIVASFGVADALAQGGVVGDLSFMTQEFVQSFVAGVAAGGAITSVLRLSTKAVFESTHNGLRKGVLLYLSICTAFEPICFLLYAYYFPKLPIVKYFRSKAASEGSETVTADLAAGGIRTRPPQNGEHEPERLSAKQLFVKNIDCVLDMFLTYALTLSIVPGFLYEDTGKHKLGSWYAIVLVASFNICDLISRYIPLINWLNLESRKGIMISVFSRFLLIPAFYFTVNHGDQGWMIALTSFLGLTNGYLTVVIFAAAPKGYKGPEQNAIGNIMVLSLLCGLSAGVVLNWLWLLG